MRMLKIVIIYIILMTIIIVPSFATQGTIKGTDVRIRKEPNTNCETLGYVSSQDEIEIIGKEENWYKIKVKEITGYVREDFIKISEETSNNQNNKSDENDIKIYIIPSITSSVIGKIENQANYTTGKTINNWTHISYENISGWAISSKIEKNKTEQDPVQNKPEEQQEQQTNEPEQQEEVTVSDRKGYINVESANLRKEPSTDSEAIAGLIKNEEIIIIIAEQEGWYKVEADGKIGYVADWLVSNKKVEVTNRSLNTQRSQINEAVQEKTSNTTQNTGNISIVEYAKQYLGRPYVYGGSGPSSFDCSGFTMYVYKKFGVSLPHTATGQSKYGTYVEKDNLQPGDMVFFKDYQTMDGIGHCGIYIGNGDFIHASSGTGYCVKISTLLSGSYLTRYETARRLI